MVFIPPPHMLQQKGGKKESPREAAVGMFVVFVIALVIALFVFIVGPRSNNPPPLVVGYAVSGFALIFGLLSLFMWIHAQNEDDPAAESHESSDRES